MTTLSLDAIPPLAFGQRHALHYTDPERMSAELARGTSVVMNYRSVEPGGAFRAQSSLIKTRNVRLVASASSAIRVDAHGASTAFFMVALHGGGTTKQEGRTLDWGKGKAGVFLPPGGCTARFSARSVIGIDIDPAAIAHVAQVMLGSKPSRRQHSFDFTEPCAVNLRGNRLDFSSIFISAASMLDHFGGDTRLIERAGLDDTILRMVALLFNFEELSSGGSDARANRAIIRLTCEYIDDNLTGPITLTDLEALTGLSRRSLQYAFRDEFDCTPMQWVARRRLEAVRKQILAARQGDTLTTIAGAYFANLGEFARMYRQQYGELPSATLRNALSRRFRS